MKALTPKEIKELPTLSDGRVYITPMMIAMDGRYGDFIKRTENFWEKLDEAWVEKK